MPNILILIATMTGTAEMIAEDIAAAHSAGFNFILQSIETASIAQVTSAEIVLLVSSTYGEGEVPERSSAFFEQLRAEGPNLSKLRYGVVTLGDSGPYPNTFANGGRLWDALLAELGAARLGEMLVLDASDQSDKSEAAVAWASNWLLKIETVLHTAECGSR